MSSIKNILIELHFFWRILVRNRILITIITILIFIFYKCGGEDKDKSMKNALSNAAKQISREIEFDTINNKEDSLANNSNTEEKTPFSNKPEEKIPPLSEVENQNINIHKEAITKDPYEDWESPNYKTGSKPLCFNFAAKYDKSIDNALKVKVGHNADVVVKLMSKTNDVCIRYVYIKSGATFTIKNIPEDIYYLKIAYGKEWKQKIDDGKCIGKFTKNALYEIGENYLNFKKKYGGVTIDENGDKYDNWSIPSFELLLDVVYKQENLNDDFDTKKISEEDFNN